MTAGMRAAMGQAAVRAAQAIGYKGAGTVEFIVDATDGLKPDGFWFMEMNTRLQVEHPVTEAITGVDLVEWQLRVAAGEPLPLAQEDLAIDGHAFEARLYAEDVPAGFLPATGRLTHLVFPKDARADSGVRAGDAISPFYDPMIAKIVVHGATRAIALLRLQAALRGTEIAGTVTNHAFLRKLAAHRDFGAGDVDTGLIARDLEALSAPPVPCTRTRALAAVASLGLPGAGASGFALWSPLSWTARLLRGEEEITARVTVQGAAHFEVDLGDVTHLLERHDGLWRIDGAQVPARVLTEPGRITVFFGNAYVFDHPDPLARGSAGQGTGDVVPAPMPGLLRAVFVGAGDTVVAGQRLAILEAMKMEHTLTATRDGVIAEVLSGPGSQVDAGAPLIRLETTDDDNG
jgi:3-methylcrotonyl-CoA carboxylase alpha subunit